MSIVITPNQNHVQIIKIISLTTESSLVLSFINPKVNRKKYPPVEPSYNDALFH